MYKVYKITNKLNGKSYIGQTMQPIYKRLQQHINRDGAIGKAIKEEGINKFDISVLDTADTKEDIDKAEIYWIKFYNTINEGYNTLKGGTPSQEELKQIQKYKKTRKNKHTRKSLKKKREQKETEFRKQRAQKIKEDVSTIKETATTTTISTNKYIEHEKEIARKMGIENYIII